MTEQFTNNATTTLNGTITNIAGTLVVTSATPFPTSPQFRIIIDSEIMLVTGVSGTTFTVTRGAENTTQVAHTNGATVSMILTAGALDQMRSDLMNVENVGHRLTLTSNIPITTSDVTGAGTIYLTAYKSARIPLFNGILWKQYTVSEISLSLSLVSGKNYDVFAYDNAGTVTLELSAAWTTDTSRSDALSRQDGVLVKSSNSTRRYLGTIRASGTNVTEDSISKRFVWNAYNRETRFLYVKDTTSSWTYATNTWRAARGQTTNSFSYVTGLDSNYINVDVRSLSQNSGAGVSVGVGIDSTSSNSAQLMGGAPGSGAFFPYTAVYKGYPGLGYHVITWLEIAYSNVSITLYGTASDANSNQTGMVGEMFG